jgi:hypothetical protein
MRSVAFLLGALLTLMTSFVVTQGAQANRKPESGTVALPVNGTLPGGTFAGTISDLSASVDRTRCEPLISGVLNGTAT